MKLPGVQYGGVQGVSAPSPQQAVTEYGQKQAILGKATAAANEISTAYREYNITKADNAYADEMAQFRKEAAKESVLTPGQIAALDLDIDTEGREYIPKIEWYPQLLQKRMEEYRGKHAASIRSPIDRDRWTNEIRRNDDKILEKEIEHAANESRKFLTVEKLNDAQNAAAAGKWDTARDVYADPAFSSTPELEAKRDAGLAAIDLAEGQEQIRDEVEAYGNNVTALMEYSDYLKTDEAHEKYPLDPNQLAAESKRVAAMAKGIEDGAKINQTKAEKQARAAGLTELYKQAEDGSLSYDQVYSMSQSEYADTGFVKSANSIWKNYKDSDGQSPYPQHRDVPVYNELRSSIIDPRVSTQDVLAEFEAAAGKLTKTDSDAFQKLIEERDDQTKADGGLAAQTLLTRQLAVYGKTSKDNPQLVAMLSTDLDRQIQTANTNGRPMTPAQIRESVDALVSDFAVPKAGGYEIDRPGSLWDAEGTTILDAISSEDPEAIPVILQILNLSDEPLSKEAIEREYRLWLENN